MIDSSIDEIKNRLDIIEIIQEYIQLKKTGANYRALCPFHNEKTPSFMASKEKQIWHCFGCGEGGDVFGFVQRMEGIEFPEALRLLAKKAGVELKRQDPVLQNQKTRFLDICKLAAAFYHKVLLESSQSQSARDYLKLRKIDSETIDQFQIGYAPESWDTINNFLKKRGYSEEDIFLAGLTVKKEKGTGCYDRFRGRLMFPVNDVHGNTVGFGGRILNDQEDAGAKYINSPQTLIYNKSFILYALDKAKSAVRKKNEAIVVEGYMDCITAHQADVVNVVASSGTALTEEQIHLLKRFTDTIIISFDQDAAGKEAAKRGIETALSQELNVKVMEIPTGKDPDECIRENKEGFLTALREAKPYLEYYFNSTFKQLDINKVEDKKKAARVLLPVIAKIADSIEQAHWLKELANKLAVEEQILRERIQQTITFKGQSRPQGKTVFNPQSQNRFYKVGEEVLSLLIFYPEEISSAAQTVAPEHFVDSKQSLLYKNMIIYYTKNDKFDYPAFQEYLKADIHNQDKKGLASYLDVLYLLGTDLFSDLEAEKAKEAVKERIFLLRRNGILSQLKTIEHKIKTIEQQNYSLQNKQELDALSEKFSQLTNQLHQLE